MELKDYPRGRMLEGADYIEVINEDIERGRVRFALFDFDGTISLIRQGWQEVMIPMMVDILMGLNTGESCDDIHMTVKEFVTRLTGKQTIYQTMALAEEIEKRGGTPLDPLEYKRQYLDLLWEQIKDRVAGLKAGRLTPVEMSVPGALDMVRALYDRSVNLYVASGTDHPYVVDEATCLGVNEFFGDRIYGALDDFKNFSKAILIEKLIRENNLHGSEFLTFGDGYVEIENCKDAGGIAIGVATDEAKREGIDEWKRNRLIDAGADLIIPDFREYDKLLRYLFAE
ncbi:HAD family hydrolase [bacterium]|nr:HAD family hydrolase [bacterium]